MTYQKLTMTTGIFPAPSFNKPMLSGMVKHNTDKIWRYILKDTPIVGCFGVSNRYTCVGNVDLHVDLLSLPVQKKKVSWINNYQMTIVWAHACPFTSSVHYPRSDMIWCGSLMERLAVLLPKMMVLWVSQSFVEVDARICGEMIPNSNVDTEQQGITTNALEGHQSTDLGTHE